MEGRLRAGMNYDSGYTGSQRPQSQAQRGRSCHWRHSKHSSLWIDMSGSQRTCPEGVCDSPGAGPRFSKPSPAPWKLTSNSMWSWSFLQVAAKVSEVPNSKYHSLFFILYHETKSCLNHLSLAWLCKIAMLFGLGDLSAQQPSSLTFLVLGTCPSNE